MRTGRTSRGWTRAGGAGLVVALAVGLIACGATPPGHTPRPQPVSPQRTGPVPMMAAGNQAVATLVVHPSQWVPLTDSLAELTTGHVPEALVRLPLSQILGELWAPLGDGELEGLDVSRPMIFRFGETQGDLDAVIDVAMGAVPPSMRHVFVFPTNDLARLRADLDARIERHCPGRRCRQLGVPHLVQNAQQIYVVFGGEETNEAALLADPGPVFAWAVEGEPPVAVHLRASNLASAMGQMGAGQVASALEHADGASIGPMRAMGLSEVLRGELISSDVGREASELAFAIDTAPLGLRVLAHVTEVGMARLGSDAASASAPRSGAAPVVLRSGLDPWGIIRAADLPYGLRTLDVRESLEAFRSAGNLIYPTILTTPMSFVHLVEQRAPAEIVQRLVDMRREPGLGRTLQIDVDTAALAMEVGEPQVAALASEIAPALHFRSELRGAAFVGVLGLEARAPGPAPALSPAPSPRADAASLACQERLAHATADVLAAVSRVAPAERRAVVEAGLVGAEQHAACVTSAVLGPRVQSYRRALALAQQLAAGQ